MNTKLLEQACRDLGPEGYKRICPEALAQVREHLFALPAEARAEYYAFMRAAREMFAPVSPTSFDL